MATCPECGQFPDLEELDCTDGAHPAWWRAHDYTADRMIDEIINILDNPKEERSYGNARLQALAARLQRLVLK